MANRTPYINDFDIKTPATAPLRSWKKGLGENKTTITMGDWLISRLIDYGIMSDPCCSTGFVPPIQPTVTTGITAHAGGGQGSAVLLTTYYNRVDTVATAGDSVKLPVAGIGKIFIIKNNTTTDLAVFPATSGTINSGSANASITIPGGDTKTFYGDSTTNWDTNQSVYSGGNGTAANPTVTFNSNSNTGMYRVAANDIGFTTNGTLRFDISTTAITSTLPHVNPVGAVGTPSYTFTGDTTTGFYRSSAGEVSFAGSGVQYAKWNSSGTSVNKITPLSANFMTIAAGVLQNYTTFAVNTSATVAAANFVKGYFTSTSGAAVTLTTDSATNIATTLGAVQGSMFDFIVDNSAGSNTVTVALGAGITAPTGAITGGTTLTVTTTNKVGVFRLVFTSSSAAVLFRIA
jgi:hypothetical protein